MDSFSESSFATSADSRPSQVDDISRDSIAYLVYHNRGDFYTAGYKPPTTADIPQIRLPRIAKDDLDEEFVDQYLQQLKNDDSGSGGEDLTSSIDLSDLNTVPSVFFEQDFHLDNPRVFDAVIGSSPDNQSEDALLQQEKLSWYVDIVEIHLINEISSHSSQFFSATAHFDEIRSQSSDLVAKLRSLRSIMEKADQQLVNHCRETLELRRKLQNIDDLMAALDQITNFITEARRLEQFWDANDLDACTQRLNDLDQLASHPVDLKLVKGLAQILAKVGAIRSDLRQIMMSALSEALVLDLQTFVIDNSESMVSSTRHNKVGNFGPLAPVKIDTKLREIAENALSNARAIGAEPDAVDRYVADIQGEIKALVLSGNSAEEKDSHLWSRTYAAFQRLAAQRKACLDVSPTVAGPRLATLVETVVRNADRQIAQ